MSAPQNWNIVTDAGGFFQQTEKRIGMEERRPRINKASDLMGPLFGPSAILLSDSMNSDVTAFNGMFVVPPNTPESPDNTKWWMGESIGQDGIGGVHVLRTFQTADYPHTIMMRGWETIAGSGGLRVYSPWEDITPITPVPDPRLTKTTAVVTFVSPFTGVTQQLVKFNDMVTLTCSTSRAAGFATTFTKFGSVPVGWRPANTVSLAASPASAGTGTPKAQLLANGDLQIATSVANANDMHVVGVWHV